MMGGEGSGRTRGSPTPRIWLGAIELVGLQDEGREPRRYSQDCVFMFMRDFQRAQALYKELRAGSPMGYGDVVPFPVGSGTKLKL